VVHDLVHKLRPQQGLAAHKRQHPASGRVQPIDRPLGGILAHPLYVIVKRPAVVAVEIAFPFGEEISDDGVKISRQNPRFEIRKQPAAHRPINERRRPPAAVRRSTRPVRGNIVSMVAQQFRMLGEHRVGQLLRFGRRKRRRWSGGLFSKQIVQSHIQPERRNTAGWIMLLERCSHRILLNEVSANILGNSLTERQSRRQHRIPALRIYEYKNGTTLKNSVSTGKAEPAGSFFTMQSRFCTETARIGHSLYPARPSGFWKQTAGLPE